MKTLLAIALSLACLSAAAEPDSRWFVAGETSDTKTYIQRGSLEQTTTEDGKPAATVPTSDARSSSSATQKMTDPYAGTTRRRSTASRKVK